MRDFEFIHASEDVRKVLVLASSLGLVIRNDIPNDTPDPIIVSADDVEGLSQGSFILYKPEWVFGDFKFDEIASGYNAGKYFQHPATNYSGLKLYFGGEHHDQCLRLGGGNLSRDVDWYRPLDHTVHLAPSDVKSTFDAIRRAIDTGKRLRGGVHNYTVLDEAWKKLRDGVATPPFDYIEWPAKSHSHEFR